MNTPNNPTSCVDAEILMSMDQYTLPQILYKQAKQLGSQKIAIREKSYAVWQPFHWAAYLRYTKHTALGLVALGLERGETIGLVLDNGPEWLFSEMGSHAAGAVVRPLGTDQETDELIAKLNQVQAAYVFVQDQDQVNTLLSSRRNLSHIKQIIYIDPSGLRFCEDDPWLISFSQLLELGEDMDNEQPDRFIKELWDGKPEDIAVLMENAGPEQGADLVMLSHANFTATAVAWVNTESMGIENNWMPLNSMAGIIEHVWAMGICLCGGLTINFPEMPETLELDFVDLAPTVVAGASGFWERLASQINVQMAHSGTFTRACFQSVSRSEKFFSSDQADDPPKPKGPSIKEWFLNKTISRPLLKRIGCHNLKAAYATGSNLKPEVLRFFRSHGLNLKQCYGLTETCGMIHVHPDGEVKTDTVGKPLPGTEIKIAEDQEILVLSPCNFTGYYDNPEATARVLIDGWFYTNQMGTLDETGHLLIIGPKDASHFKQ